jgi:hypothetical protein
MFNSYEFRSELAQDIYINALDSLDTAELERLKKTVNNPEMAYVLSFEVLNQDENPAMKPSHPLYGEKRLNVHRISSKEIFPLQYLPADWFPHRERVKVQDAKSYADKLRIVYELLKHNP